MFVLACALVVSTNAQAQTCSTTADKDALKACVYSGVETCREASACNDYEAVLTIKDVREFAINNCCSKRSKTARSLCLVKEKKKYVSSVSSGQQRIFLRAARANVIDVKNNVCKNTTYEFPADSALF